MEDKPVVTDPFVTLYTIMSILEDVDFGCEDRADGDIPKAIAVLVSDDREEMKPENTQDPKSLNEPEQVP